MDFNNINMFITYHTPYNLTTGCSISFVVYQKIRYYGLKYILLFNIFFLNFNILVLESIPEVRIQSKVEIHLATGLFVSIRVLFGKRPTLETI